MLACLCLGRRLSRCQAPACGKWLYVMQNDNILTLLDLCVSSLRRGHANLLCIVPILTDDPRRESDAKCVWEMAVTISISSICDY